MTKPKITILVGPMCGGKSTLQKTMIERDGYTKIITETDRPIREGEIDGVDYNFHGPKKFSVEDRNEILVPRSWKVANGDTWNYWLNRGELEKVIFDNDVHGVIILDPRGANLLIGELLDEYNISPFVMEVTAPLYQLATRAGGRGDDIEEFLQRTEDDEKYLDIFRKLGFVDVTVGSVADEVEPDSKKLRMGMYTKMDERRE